MRTLLEIIKRSTEFLAGKGIDSPRLNAELLIGHALGLKRMELYLQFERPLTEGELEKIRPLIRRRSQREPVQYILGETEFCGLKIKVDRRALIPRPETEQLVEAAIALFPLPPAAVLDLGTGTGAIAIALAAAFPAAAVTAVEASAAALDLARENAAATPAGSRVTFLQSNWFAALPPTQRFELIVGNPPYLSKDETAETAPEVREFEPHAALTSDGGGMSDLRSILDQAPSFLAPGGWLVLEAGCSQGEALRAAAGAAGFAQVESRSDLTGRERFLLARLPEDQSA